MQFHVDPHSPVPPSQQLVATVLDAIATGALRTADKLPAVRAVAEQALVNPNTVGKAWRELEHLGVTAGRNGAGVFVTDGAAEVARALRLSATLEQLKVAVAQALRAGHEPATLVAMLELAVQGERIPTGRTA